jgi:hypothetical protein
VQSILQRGLDRVPEVVPEPAANASARTHANVRGGTYYH